MEFEIWASDSGNLLLVTPDLNEALAWALDYWLREGNDALDALSIGDEQDQWCWRASRSARCFTVGCGTCRLGGQRLPATACKMCLPCSQR